MRLLATILLFLFTTGNSYAQKDTTENRPLPEYPGGETAWTNFIQKNFNISLILDSLPVDVQEKGDTSYARLWIDKSGIVQEFEKCPSSASSFRTELQRVLKKSKAWLPAIKNGQPINGYRSYRFIFFQVADLNGLLISPADFPGKGLH